MRVQAWLRRHAAAPLRCLFAPAGAGKTTCAVAYARANPGRVIYVALAPLSGPAALISTLALAAGCGFADDYAMLLDKLSVLETCEIIIDDLEHADARAYAVLARLYIDAPANVTFVYIARSQSAVALGSARARGLAEVIDPAFFAFDSDEVLGLCASLAVAADRLSGTALVQAANGWAMAVAGACRTAASEGLPLAEALREWERLNHAALNELCGHIPVSIVADRTARAAPAFIQMFGRFEMSIAGNPIVWSRRRDHEIVAYLAMQPKGCATRTEIIAAFWPEADRQLAGQSLRTACSTIRRAIASCVGRTNVEQYFIGEHVVALNFENVTVSALEFANAFHLGEHARLQHDAAAAFRHYRAAEVLYRSPFLAGEPRCQWSEPFEERYAHMYRAVVTALDELGADPWASEIGEPKRVSA